ncbi:hypothetical protein [Rufibacter quisquiliarum]|uniref:Uncharacterized protein n=2 Tax=Rufibacter quisquiliarum TaxID=1549639 RepID=A0A839H0A9_9BACT|nr:hypothetical protein [Rufibacter quisquiliarum]MBA9079361.1 hypothetical protein [Rufibacter quisquiliarum]
MRRLIVLMFLLPVWAYGGCQSRQEPDTPRVTAASYRPANRTAPKSAFQRNYNNTATMTAFYERTELAMEENPEVRKASDFIANPFLPAVDPALKHYVAQLKTRYQVVKDTIANVHNPRYTDTLFQLNFDSSTVELYYPMYTKRFLLSYADIKSPNLALRNGLKVGTPREELLQKLQGYKLFIKEQKNLIEVCDWERNSWLRFHMTKGRVSSIQYEGYID